VIFRDLTPTGDGLLTGLLLAELIVRRGPLADLAGAAWRRVPQELLNVSRDHFSEPAVQALFDELLATYGVERDDVRLLVRPSGTEPLVRIMIEALNAEFVEVFCERVTSLYGN
jgi:phosphoglucosamine mutase